MDEKTKVSLYAVAAATPFIVGSIMWLTTIDAKASTAKEELNGLKQLVLDVRERVIRIEDKFDTKPRGDK